MSTAEILAELPLLSPADRDAVRARLDELAEETDRPAVESLLELPFVGLWKDRTDLPADADEASRVLRGRMMRTVAPEGRNDA